MKLQYFDEYRRKYYNIVADFEFGEQNFIIVSKGITKGGHKIDINTDPRILTKGFRLERTDMVLNYEI